MTVWALADLHLAFSIPDKNMDFFGHPWTNYTDKIQENWLKKIKKDDLVLIAGDISWANTLEEAKIDLAWIDALPGTKVMIKGNHDNWWSSLSKVSKILPPTIHLIQNNAFDWQDITIGGTRLWDGDYSFHEFIDFKENTRAKKLDTMASPEEAKRIYIRELGRLELSLKSLNKSANKRIVMTHYPPIAADLSGTLASTLLEKYRVDTVVFGHLHNVKKDALPFGTKNGVNYKLVSADYIDFDPILIY